MATMQAAAQAFEEAAKASPDKDPRTARMYAAAGNMWIAASQPGKAAFDLDRALALPGLEAEQRGEALLDRARAAEAQDDLKTARAKAERSRRDHLRRSLLLVLLRRPGDPREATRRPRKCAIDKALTLAPSDPTILFEAGHVADFAGDDDKARSYWMRAAAATPTARSARPPPRRVEMLGVTPTVKSEPPSRLNSAHALPPLHASGQRPRSDHPLLQAARARGAATDGRMKRAASRSSSSAFPATRAARSS